MNSLGLFRGRHNMASSNAKSGSSHSKTPPFSQNSEDAFLNFSEFAESLLDNKEETDNTPTIISKKPAPDTNHGGKEYSSFPVEAIRGKRLSHFELIAPIGVGGMAAVLRACDTQLDRTVALKILPPDMAAEPENVRRFHQEARAAAKLDHENVARVFFCGEDQSLHFIAFEFVEGDNLRTILQRRGRLPIAEAVHYMLQITTGLAHAADRQVVHRDIKPSNIIITPEGRAKLVDMGLARSKDASGSKDLTQSGVTLGTFDYISPEQALDPREADYRSDIYSLGCTFYHAVTGQSPVPEGTAAKKLHHHQHVGPVDPRELNPNVPDSVAAILAKMMAKEPKDRYQECEQLVQHLLHVTRELGTSPKSAQSMLYVDTPLPAPPRSRFALLAPLALVGLVLVLVFLAFAPTQPKRITQPSVTDLFAPQQNIPEPNFHPKEESKKKPNGPVVDKNHNYIKTSTEFAQACSKRGNERNEVQLYYDFKLTPGEVFAPENLIVKGMNDQPTTITIPCDSDSAKNGWLIKGGNVVFRNIHFRMEIQDSGEMSGLVLENTKNVRFEECRFSQVNKAKFTSSLDRVSSVRTDNTTTTGVGGKVELSRCLFDSGHTAFSVNGPESISLTDCAILPHNTVFVCRGDSTLLPQNVDMENCSVLMQKGDVFRVVGKTHCKFSAKRSIFSNPPPTVLDPVYLIHQLDEDSLVYYSGERNVYHNFDGYWNLPGSTDSFVLKEFPEFRKELVALRSDDVHSSPLEEGQNPWRSATPLQEPTNVRMFHVSETLAEVRELDNYEKPSRNPIGVQDCVWGKTYNGPLPDLNKKPSKPLVVKGPKEIIVDPINGPFTTLAAAIGVAKSGDVISIKSDGLLEINTVFLDQKLDITIRPFKGCQPILTLQEKKESSEPDAALFKMDGSKITFRNLAFLLNPRYVPKNRKIYRSQSVAVLAGSAQCVFENCLVTLVPTLEPQLEETSLRVLTLQNNRAETKNMVKGKLQMSPVPSADFSHCFIRGEGTMLYASQSIPFDVNCSHCLLTLYGNMLEVNGEMQPLEVARGLLKLTQTTTYLTDHLVYLADNNQGKGLIPTEVRATKCLFASAEKNPLIKIDGIGGNKSEMEYSFQWSGGGENVYCGFYEKQTMQQNPAGFSSPPPTEFDSVKWNMTIAKEADPIFMSKTLKFDSLKPGDFARLKLADVSEKIKLLQIDFTTQPDMNLLEYGASLSKLEQRLSDVDSQPVIENSFDIGFPDFPE